MADRRSDDSPVAPRRSLAGPEEPPAENAAAQPATPAPVVPPRPQDLTERINAAYASSGPVLPDESAKPARPTGAERFAAVLAASKVQSKSKSQPGTTAATAATAATTKTRGRAAARRPRRARLRLTHVDPWSVMKTAFLLSVAIGIVTVVAVAVVWSVLGAAGVWDSINQTVSDVVGETGSGFRIEDYLGMSRVMGFTMIVAVVDVVLLTVIATLGAFLYNLAAVLLGGIEVVLAEEE
jgi:hypothetical protein